MKHIKNMKIGKLLIVTFLIVTIISSISGIVGLFVLNNTNSSYSNALDNYGFAQGDVGRLSSEFNNNRAIIRDVIFYTDKAKIDSAAEKLEQSAINMDKYMEEVNKVIVNEKETAIYNSIKENLDIYDDISARVVSFAKENKNAEAQTLLTTEGTAVLTKVNTSLNELLNLKTTTGDELGNNLSTQANVTAILIIIIILISVGISISIAVKISNQISKPVKEMADVAQKLADGNLNVNITVADSDNEIGQLSRAFADTISSLKGYISEIKWALSKIADGDLTIQAKTKFKGDFTELQDSILYIISALNETLTNISRSSEQVSAGSEQVSNASQALAQGATEQASSIEELSASITEISSHVKENAENAEDASNNVSEVASEIELSNKHMNNMVDAMSQINEASNQIGRIIKTIQDIAFQTNILSLNAAVEAARAGAAGKGFAVVADEVRNLASKSAEAAKDTTALIENSVRQVENGSKIADQTAQSLKRVVTAAEKVSKTVESISKSSALQSSAIDQVTIGVEQISSVVQTNSATAEESAAASEEFSGQAQALKLLVGKFKLKKQSDSNISNSQNLQESTENTSESSENKY